MKIKICGLSQDCDIDYVNEARPDFIGFVFAESRRQVSLNQAEILRHRLNPGIIPVGVFVNAPLSRVIKLLKAGIIEMAQLHGGESEAYIRELKGQMQKPVIKSVRVTCRADIEAAQDTVSDYLLLDHGTGGTGQRFDWGLIGTMTKPYFLAGGLNTGNINQALTSTHPYAVDLSSGVETDGRKDRKKILAMVRRVRHV